MAGTFLEFVGSGDFMPHGHCFLWTPSLLWIYVVSDFAIAASYFSIPFALWYFVQKRPDVPFRWIFVMFGAFVLACGATHLFAIWNIWHADYWADAGLKAITASVSVATAILLWPLIPKALTIPSHIHLEHANQELQAEMARRTQAETALLVANADLERRVAERTAEVQAREADLRRAQSIARVGSWVLDVKAKELHGSAEALRILGASGSGPISYKAFLKLVHPDDREAVDLASRASLKGKPYDIEYRILAGATTRWVHSNAELVFDADGKLSNALGTIQDITERKKTDQALRESEEGLRAIFDGALDGILVADVATKKLLTANTAICRMLGYTHEEIIGISVSDIHPKQDLPRAIEQFESQSSGKLQTAAIIPMTRKDRSVIFAEIKAAPIRLGGKECLLGIFRDITERRAAEAKIQHLTQLYIALSQCNEAIVRCVSEEELFPQICRTAVQFGGMKMGWIGIIDPDSRMVRPAARFGDHADEYLQGIEISVDADSPLGRGPTGTAIRGNQPFWCQDFQNDPLTAPWHESGARFGWGASASLPLLRNGVPIGVLTLYSGEVGAFDAAVRHLLVEMATDISFALDNFAREAARTQAEKDLRAAEEQFRGLVEQSIAGIYIIQDEKLAYVNQRYAEIFGYKSAEELIGRERFFVVAERDRAAVSEQIRQRFEGKPSASYDFSAVRKDGATIEIGAHATRATYLGRPAIVGLMQDISEKKRADEQIQRYVEQLKTAFMSSVEVATALSEMRDPYTAGHERRVAEIAVAIGAELGLDEHRQEGLRVAGYLHDVGKITIPAEILSKPGKLSTIEFQLVRAHAQASYDVLKNVQFPWPVAEVALQHHERMDGSGYPQGLKGEAILLEARIMAVADVVEAVSGHRPYRAALGIDKALAEIERGRGTAYDPVVADACLRRFREKGYQLPP